MPVRRLQPITRDLVEAVRGLPDDPTAGLWGLSARDAGGATPGPVPGWAGAALDAWGMVGVLMRDPDCTRFMLVAPGLALPQSHPMRRVPRTRGAAVLVAVHCPSHRRPGPSPAAGRQMCQFLAGRLVGSVPAIEAGGVPGPGALVDPRLGSLDWLESLGFRTVDPLDAAPVRRMQLDLRRTVRQDDLGHRVMAWLRGMGGEPVRQAGGGYSSRGRAG